MKGPSLARYVIDKTVVLHLLAEGIELPTQHKILAPTLVRDEVLEALYHAVAKGELERDVALERLARFSTMKIRYLGDKVLRRRAWTIAEELGWGSTSQAEYLALTQLQADAFITLDPALASAAADVVATAELRQILPS